MRSLNEVSIMELNIMLRNKVISARETVEWYLKRIDTMDKGSGGLNSIIEINEEAIEIAKEIDAGGYQDMGLLAGIPILLKDNINTGDQMHTSAGSLALAGAYALEDAELVKTLRAKGAILLGKTNMTEFANYMTKGMPGGYSSRGGQVISPYKRGEDPSGSSTGSAVAVAANLCTASIGTDTSNSIIVPGLRNGLVGFRPSIHAISSRGILPASFTLDTAGPMTRCVSDAAILFSELTNNQIHIGNLVDFNKLTIGVNLWGQSTMSEEDALKNKEIIEELGSYGADIKYIELKPTQNVMKLMKYEFKYAINGYLRTLKDYPMRTLQDIIAFNTQHEKECLKYGQSYLIEAEEMKGDLKEAEYQEIRLDRENEIRNLKQELKGIDICMMLAGNNILPYTGYPEITIPCGLYKNGMPFGIMLTAKSDSDLLKYAYAIEMAVGYRVEPAFG